MDFISEHTAGTIDFVFYGHTGTMDKIAKNEKPNSMSARSLGPWAC
jgi:hypothetical protein